MDWRAKVELFEEIRREYEFGVGTILGVAKKLGVHRRMVREALGNAVPSRRKKAVRKRPRLAPVIPFIDSLLESDRAAPRKQRHTAHRIYQRLRGELPGREVAESTVRRYVREQKQALGLKHREVCVPQSYEWGSEGQVDWYEAEADLGGERQKLQVFSMRGMATIPGVPYLPEDKDPLLRQWRTMWAYCQKHPNGPFVYGPWDSFPIWPDTKARHAYWLNRYLPLVEEGSRAYLEIHDSDLLDHPLPPGVIASAFVNFESYLVLANYGSTAARVRTSHDYVTEVESAAPPRREWELSSRSFLILRRSN